MQQPTIHINGEINELIYGHKTGQALISFSTEQCRGSLQRAKEILVEETLKNLINKGYIQG